jgi:hypothetical protein
MREWFYYVGEQVIGPLPEDDIRAMVSSGELGMDSLVWDGDPQEGGKGWVRIQDTSIGLPQPPAGIAPPFATQSPPTSSNEAVFSDELKSMGFWIFIVFTVSTLINLCFTGMFSRFYSGRYDFMLGVVLCSKMIDVAACLIPAAMTRYVILKRPVERLWVAVLIAFIPLNIIGVIISMLFHIVFMGYLRSAISVLMMPACILLVLISEPQ